MREEVRERERARARARANERARERARERERARARERERERDLLGLLFHGLLFKLEQISYLNLECSKLFLQRRFPFRSDRRPLRPLARQCR